jgi:hypothetical protein
MVIKAPAKEIKDAGTKISGLKEDLKAPVASLNAIDPKPGDFTEATNLKNTINDRKNESIKFAGDIAKELDGTSTKLGKNADGIETTEDENQWKADGVMPQ